MRFIVAFNRDRDSYQVPVALHETGDLELLVTDYYAGAGVLRLPGLSGRHNPLLPSSVVRGTTVATLRQYEWELRRRMRRNVPFPSRAVDGALARHVARIAARRPGTGLLLYSGYAADVFRRFQDRRRVLFQFHPPRSRVRDGIASDELRDYRDWLPEPELQGDAASESAEADEIHLADTVICASSFTADGVQRIAPASHTVIVPYGCPPPTQGGDDARPLRFLFVGQGLQRKGLHLLITAWDRVRPSGATLTIVAYRVDDAILELARGVPAMTLLRGTSSEGLAALYAGSDTLVLPSLVEGFGLVIGEALAAGLRVIASTNTGLHDLRPDESIGRVVPAGEVDALADAIRWAVGTFDPGGAYRESARALARRSDWPSFRRGIRVAAAGHQE